MKVLTDLELRPAVAWSIQQETQKKPRSKSNRPVRLPRILYHLKTLWLFTRSDLKSMIYPNIFFGCTSALSGLMTDSGERPSPQAVIFKVPIMLIWLWSNLLLFNVANQRLPASAVEDAINKPWRPVPAKRIEQARARHLLLILIPVVILTSHLAGILWHSLFLAVLTWMYNDLGGSDDHFIVRNILNAHGMAFYSAGALQLAVGTNEQLGAKGLQWICILALVTFSTLQVQDLEDQAGDRIKGRRTLPLVMGDGFARRTIACGVSLWSLAAPSFWKPTVAGYVLPVSLGLTLSLRVLFWRSLEADRRSWRLWSVWMVGLYLVPHFAPGT